jgi:FkbH-like protein
LPSSSVVAIIASERGVSRDARAHAPLAALSLVRFVLGRSPTMTRYRVSRFVTSLARDDQVLLCHGPSMQRITVAPDLAEALELFRDGGSIDDLAEACGDEIAARHLVELFARHALLIPEDIDEDALWAERLGLAGAPVLPFARETVAPKFDKIAAVTRADITASAAATLTPLKVVLIGGCFVEVLADFVKKAAMRRGYLAEVSYHWPDGADAVRRGASATADLAVLHPFIRVLLEPVWSTYGHGAPELEARVGVLIARIRAYVGAFADGLAGRLGLVHNLTAPQVSPKGRHDYTFFQLVHRINDALADACAAHANLVLVNEEAIASTIGKGRVLDDLHTAYSHHGHGYTSQHELPRWADAERSAAFCTALADHQLDAHETWRGRRRIKCVVTDLDHTLWPGVAGDEGVDYERVQYFEGAHEALALLRSRGILLATCSKNDEATALAAWRRLPAPHYLQPEDFVVHCINWRRKSDNIAELATRLGLGLDAILFIDDSPIEREEVRRALPAVTVWDGAVEDLRSFLLTCARLDQLVTTDESARRTEMMQAQLRRDDLRAAAGSDHDFLRSLEIAIDVARATPSDAARIAELIQRTNQFNTSLTRDPPDAVAASIARGELWCLHVRDRFTDYGLVGAIHLVGADPGAGTDVDHDHRAPRIEAMVLSCRVIGLQVAVPFLATVVIAARVADAQPRGAVVIGPRNEPARSVFADAGFTSAGDGAYVLTRADGLARVDATIYRVTCRLLAAPAEPAEAPAAPAEAGAAAEPLAPHHAAAIATREAR